MKIYKFLSKNLILVLTIFFFDFSTFKEKEAQRLREYRERRKMSKECLSPNSSQERR